MRVSRRISGRKGMLARPEQKLLFILYCMKLYPAFDVLAPTFGLPRFKTCKHAHRLARAPEREVNTRSKADVLLAVSCRLLERFQCRSTYRAGGC